MEGADDIQRTPLDDVDHLARSPHRAQVVQLFATDDLTRRELHEETDISQPTLGRILGSFQDRNWLVRNGETYSLTLHGHLLATHFKQLLDVVDTIQKLPTSANFDPLLELGFEADWLASIDVATSTNTTDSYAHIRRARESVKGADRIRELSPGPMPGMAEVISDRLHAGELTIETVFPRDAFDAFIADPEHQSLIGDMLETGNFRLFLFDDGVPCYIARQGERAAFDIATVDGTSIAFLTTSNQSVLEWVESTIDDFQDRAELVTVDDLDS